MFTLRQSDSQTVTSHLYPRSFAHTLSVWSSSLSLSLSRCLLSRSLYCLSFSLTPLLLLFLPVNLYIFLSLAVSCCFITVLLMCCFIAVLLMRARVRTLCRPCSSSLSFVLSLSPPDSLFLYVFSRVVGMPVNVSNLNWCVECVQGQVTVYQRSLSTISINDLYQPSLPTISINYLYQLSLSTISINDLYQLCLWTNLYQRSLSTISINYLYQRSL